MPQNDEVITISNGRLCGVADRKEAVAENTAIKRRLKHE